MVLKNLNSKNTLIVILGPTAIGKTALSINIAKYFNTEIISADSRQFYKELKIGAAPPSSEELNTIKHYFIGNLTLHDYYNVSIYEKDVLNILETIFKNNKIALMVGGSGLYIDAVCSGIDDLPNPEPEIRQTLNQTFEKEGIEALRFQLKLLDPEYYYMVDLANPKRLIRAIEVCLVTGETYSSLRTKPKQNRKFNIIKIGLNRKREDLFDIINKRVDSMIDKGLIEEAKELYPYKSLNSLNTVGYKELFEYFDNKISLEKAIEKIKTNTRRFAKRQLTWFLKDKDIQWMHPGDTNQITNYIEALL
jgi:tRNA dimethylallyltransferase